MKKYLISAILMSFFLFFAGVFLSKGSVFVSANDDKVKICHSTDSQANPYVSQNPNKSGDVSGHDGHNGVVWYSGIADHSWGDIIPPFEYCPSDSDAYTSTDSSKACTKKVRGVDKYTDALSYAGKNWDAAGQSIWRNDCNVSMPTATATSTATATPSDDPTPTATATPSDDPTPTATATATATSTPSSTSTPEPSNDSGIGGGEVLGTSTMAATGGAMDAIFYSMFTFGSLLTSFGIMKNGKKAQI